MTFDLAPSARPRRQRSTVRLPSVETSRRRASSRCEGSPFWIGGRCSKRVAMAIRAGLSETVTAGRGRGTPAPRETLAGGPDPAEAEGRDAVGEEEEDEEEEDTALVIRKEVT